MMFVSLIGMAACEMPCTRDVLRDIMLLQCEECGTTETPTWRRWGPTLLCNACGLRRKKNPKLQPPPRDAPPAEPPAQHSWDPSAQHSADEARSGDHSQLSHAVAAVHQ